MFVDHILQNRKKLDAFENKAIRVPFFVPSINNDDSQAIKDALSKPLLTDGPKLQRFESMFSKFTGAKYAIGVSNGTAALHLSLKAIGVGKGDEIIIPDMTFVATASAVLMTDATPVLADVEKNDLNISVNSIKKVLTSKTRAIIAVHFAGNVCEIEKIKHLAKKNNLLLIEDCAHAIGVKYRKKHVGLFGNAGCFSFYPTKNITTIEGGMVITNSKKIAQYVTNARNHGITKSLKQRFSYGKPWDYDIKEIGYNYRLDEIRSSLGISQLKRIKKLNLLRKNAYNYYNSKLSTIKGIEIPKILDPNESSSYHLYIIKIKKEYGMSRDKVFDMLLRKGIRTSVHYKPLHKFTIIKKRSKIINSLKNSKETYRELLSLPLYATISRQEQDYVIKILKNKK